MLYPKFCLMSYLKLLDARTLDKPVLKFASNLFHTGAAGHKPEEGPVIDVTPLVTERSLNRTHSTFEIIWGKQVRE